MFIVLIIFLKDGKDFYGIHFSSVQNEDGDLSNARYFRFWQLPAPV